MRLKPSGSLTVALALALVGQSKCLLPTTSFFRAYPRITHPLARSSGVSSRAWPEEVVTLVSV